MAKTTKASKESNKTQSKPEVKQESQKVTEKEAQAEKAEKTQKAPEAKVEKSVQSKPESKEVQKQNASWKSSLNKEGKVAVNVTNEDGTQANILLSKEEAFSLMRELKTLSTGE